ncbi:MAG: hypothetical protein ACKO27_02335, partial [Ilumatobacteraceae bacterium]
YAVGPATTDKDGISTALIVVRALERLPRREGQGLDGAVQDLFDDLAHQFGAHRTCNGSVRLEVPAGPVVERLRGTARVGGTLVQAEDEPAPGALRWLLHDDTRVVLRGSGTEPKAKFYVEARVQVGDEVGAAWRTAAAQAGAAAAAAEELLRTAAG